MFSYPQEHDDQGYEGSGDNRNPAVAIRRRVIVPSELQLRHAAYKLQQQLADGCPCQRRQQHQGHQHFLQQHLYPEEQGLC